MNLFIVITALPIPASSDNSGSVAIISVTAIGGVLTLITTIKILLFVIMLVYRIKKKSSNKCNHDSENFTIQLSLQSDVSNDDHNPQQHMQNTHVGRPQSYHDDEDKLSGEDENYPASGMETINELYISVNADSHNSILQQDKDESIAVVVDSDVAITPNPSYSVMPQIRAKSEQYDCIQTDDKLLQCKKFGSLQPVDTVTSDEVYNKIIDPVGDHDDYVNSDLNPSYSLSQRHYDQYIK